VQAMLPEGFPFVSLKAPSIPVLVNLIPKIKTNQNKQQYFTDNHSK